jgi:putative hemolysin
MLSDIESQKYTIRIAKTEEEVDAALRLRYRVFKEELDRQFTFSGQRDKDQYDDQSHHLIVIDNDSKEVVGTYRLQTYEQARDGNGFVSSKRFRIDQFPDHVLENAVEVGRACISPEHRSGRVLFLLWKGFAEYLAHFNKRYLFGYAAFSTTDLGIVLNTCRHLREEGHYHPDYYIEAKPEYKIDPDEHANGGDKIDIPPLFENYLNVDSMVCSEPSFDKEVKLAHCLILLDVENISDRTRKLFFG